MDIVILANINYVVIINCFVNFFIYSIGYGWSELKKDVADKRKASSDESGVI